MTLRIFSAVRHSSDPARYYGDLWSRNFYPALRELGCEIVESQTDLLATSRFMDIACDFTQKEREARAQTTERILDEVRNALAKGPLHLFLGYFYNSHFDPAGFDELRRLGIPSVNFYCNSIYQFDYVAQIAKAADFSWHAERDAHVRYAAAGARPVWVQFGADPTICHPIAADRKADVCFVGQRYADRDRWLAALARSGVPLVIYGHGWCGPESIVRAPAAAETSYLGRTQVRPGSTASYLKLVAETVRTQGFMGGAARLKALRRYQRDSRALSAELMPHVMGRAPDLTAAFGAHEVILNFSNVWADRRPGSVLIPHVRLRDFEAPMSRTCYLTGHTDEITEFYDIGTEIDTYRSTEELVDKTKFYLAHPDSAERLREAGWRRARRDHTWTRRFETLFRKIGLAPSAA